MVASLSMYMPHVLRREVCSRDVLVRPEHVLDLFLRADHGSHSVEKGLAFVKFLEDLVLGGDQVSDDLLEVGSTFGHLFFVPDQL